MHAAMLLGVAGLDKLAHQKREEAGSKALPALGKRSRLELDEAEEEAPAASTSQKDAGNKAQPRQYRSNRLDTPSHPGQLHATRLRVHQYLAMHALQGLRCMFLHACLLPCMVCSKHQACAHHGKYTSC